MEPSPIYRDLESGEEQRACDFITKVFNVFVAPLFSSLGINEFLSIVDAERLRNRLQANHFVLVSVDNNQIAGLIEVRNFNHISLFFVEGERQKQGIGRELLRRALCRCLANHPDLTTVTVNASPNAVGAYESLGFEPEGSEKTTMAFALCRWSGRLSEDPFSRRNPLVLNSYEVKLVVSG